MSLRDRLASPGVSGLASSSDRLYTLFGVRENPFPSASQTSGHPRFEDTADAIMADLVRAFEMKEHPSQVVVVEGTQGVGKTNLLNHYESELRDYYADRPGFHVIRYYADPQPGFDAIVQSVVQELGIDHLRRIAQALHSGAEAGEVRSADMRAMLRALGKAGSAGGDQEVLELAHGWLLGQRVLNAHRAALGIEYRLDTVESRTQSLRDLVTVSANLGVLEGVFLLLDELEKHQGVIGPKHVVRYLLALRALIDALPKHLFLVLAITPNARRDYSLMVPSVANRLQRIITLEPLTDSARAVALCTFYLDHARRRAAEAEAARPGQRLNAGAEDPVSRDRAAGIFQEMLGKGAEKGIRGVLQRDYLHQLHLVTADVFNARVGQPRT